MGPWATTVSPSAATYEQCVAACDRLFGHWTIDFLIQGFGACIAAKLVDPDGNRIEAVYHARMEPSRKTTYPSLAVNSVLKNVLCQIDTDRRNFHFRTLPSILLQMVEATILAR
jgi:hypothetical protein